MNRKSILLVSSAFYPEISPRSFRATELAKEFYRQGHQVVVISKHREFDYKEFLNEFPITFKMWRKPVFSNIPDFKQKPFSLLSRAFSRLLSLLFEYPAIEEMLHVKKMLKDEKGYDLMISFAVPFPVHWGVAQALSEKHQIAKTWIADCGDPYMFARLDSFKKPFYFKFLEANFCSKCDYISIPFKEMQNQFYPRFISKIRTIPQGFDFEEIRLHEGPRNNRIPVFIFAGSIIPGKRDLASLFDFLTTITIDFLFIVYTNQKEWFNKYKMALGKKLEINGYIERLSLIYEMSKADFLVNIDTVLDNQSNTEAVPSKLIDYALTNRPILNINSASFDKEIVLKFLDKDYSGQRVVEKSKYDIKKVSAKFLELIRVN
jgi:hypothetical protein